MSLFHKKNLKKEEYVLRQSLVFLGMKKTTDEKIEQTLKDPNNESAFKDFFGPYNFMFAIPSGEKLKFSCQSLDANEIKKKIVLIIRARSGRAAPAIDDTNVS